MAAVRRLFGWMAGLVSIAALARWFSARRARSEAQLAPPPPTDDPADALRKKLDETRPPPAVTEPELAVEPTPEPEPSETLDERRARIHAKAQEAIDAMQEPPA